MSAIIIVLAALVNMAAAVSLPAGEAAMLQVFNVGTVVILLLTISSVKTDLKHLKECLKDCLTGIRNKDVVIRSLLAKEDDLISQLKASKDLAIDIENDQCESVKALVKAEDELSTVEEQIIGLHNEITYLTRKLRVEDRKATYTIAELKQSSAKWEVRGDRYFDTWKTEVRLHESQVMINVRLRKEIKSLRK